MKAPASTSMAWATTCAACFLALRPAAGAAAEFDTEVTLTSEADIAQRRADIIKFIWGASGLPKNLPTVNKNVQTLSQCSNIDLANNACNAQSKKDAQSILGPLRLGPLRNLKRIDDLIFNMESGERSIAHHFIAKQSNNRLVIMHEGHGCNLDLAYVNAGPDEGGLVHAMDELLAQGYSVLGMYMPHYQPDLCDVGLHDGFVMNTPVQQGHVVKFYVEPIVVSLNYLKTKSASDDFPSYISYDMVGLSGGGWTTVFYSAFDPTIERSVDGSGSGPFFMRKCSTGKFGACASEPGGNGYDGYVGDAEQALPAIYKVSGGYLDLYTMDGQGKDRHHIQIVNRVDETFAGPGPATMEQTEKNLRDYEKVVKAAVARTNAGAYDLVIDTVAPHHMISPWATANVILPLLDRGKPADASAPPDTVTDAAPAKPGPQADAAAPAGEVDAAAMSGATSKRSAGGSCAIAGTQQGDARWVLLAGTLVGLGAAARRRRQPRV